MKGTFFSTDFVKHKDGDYRFIELNTDTAEADINSFSSGINLNEWFQFLHDSNIDTIEIIYKREIHARIVNVFKNKIETDATFITNVIEHVESMNTVFPTEVEDADNKFILRLAYDENAVLDSIYAKNSLNPLLLFNENNSGDDCLPFYYSSSTDYVNTLELCTNPLNLPDLVIKSNSNTLSSVEFFKIKGELISGSYTSSAENLQDRIDDFISTNLDSNRYASNFLIHPDSIEDNVVQSLRMYSIVTIVEGTPNLFHLYQFNGQASFSLPSSLDTDLSEHFKLPSRHYYELSTSTSKEKGANKHGIFETERFVSSSEEAVGIEDVKIGDILKSYHIDGLPDSDNYLEYGAWFITGSSLSENSYSTSSTVVSIFSQSLQSNELIEVKLQGGSEYRYFDSGVSTLVYESSSNETKFIPTSTLLKDNHYIYNESGGLTSLDETNFIVLNTPTGSIYTVDVEPSDIIITEGSTLGTIGMVIHNFGPGQTCFIAGTRITMGDFSQKNIEDIVKGDRVCTYNFETSELESNNVTEVVTKLISGKDDDYTVIVNFDNGSTNHNTNSHPYYVKGKGWSSYRPDITFSTHGMDVELLEVGDVVFELTSDRTLSEITVTSIGEYREPIAVYNLSRVENNHNFFANSILVHNKFAP